MKNLIKIFSLCLLVVLTGCEDNEKAPFPEVENGAYVYVDIQSTVIDVTDIENSTYGGILYAPSDNVESHSFSVRRISGGVASEFAEVYTATSFPAEFRVGASEITAALGIELSDVLPGDQFDFVGTTVSTDGDVVTFDNLGTDLAGETGQRQAYNLVTFVSCPFVQADALGTYNIISLGGFGLNNVSQFEVVAGDNPNQIIAINPFGGNEAYDIAIDVNDSGIATVERQFAFSTTEICCSGFEPTTVEGDGFVFSCSGAIQLSLVDRIVQLGTGAVFGFGGSPAIIAQKVN